MDLTTKDKDIDTPKLDYISSQILSSFFSWSQFEQISGSDQIKPEFEDAVRKHGEVESITNLTIFPNPFPIGIFTENVTKCNTKHGVITDPK